MAEAQNCTPRSVWRGSQTPQRLLDTPRSVRRGTKILNQENVTPEVCPEVVRNAVTTFSTSPKGMPSRVQTVDFPLDTPEVRLEVVPKESLSFSTAPRSVLRGLKIRNPENVTPEVCLAIRRKCPLRQIRRIPEAYPSGSGKS